MRRFVRNNIIGLLNTISEGLAHALTVDEGAANSALADCLEGMNAIAEILEQELSSGRYAQYSRIISEICLALEELLTDIVDLQYISELAEKVFIALVKLVDLLKTEQEIKKEIVFFPYKASMWDSLESIWNAAVKDGRCYVTVVPIPYYDRDTRGNLADMHYEGQDFPDYVNIVHYEEYDIEAIEPDVAYIHNPYDGNNLVTSVHPSYYSRELKKHVKTLVYVPYYASYTPPTLAFAAPTAALAVDLIIASSKEDADAMRRAGAKCEMVALGSPKIDRIINMEKERPAIPDEWGKLKGKKIFFLNTSVSSMLRFNKDYFSKIQALISLFESRGDAALLWRPHPLTMSTIDSMRPDLREPYLSLEEIAKNSGSAVIDLSPDMGVSMAISDAYIGDGASSLIYLFALTGKPLYMLNFKMPLSPTEDELNELKTSEIVTPPCIDGDVSWVFCANINALCMLDISSGKAEFIASVPGEDNRWGLYGKPVKNGESLLLPPARAKEWAEYDIRSDTWKKIPIPDKALPVTRHGACFATALDTDEYAIFTPVNNRAFAKYDKKAGKIEYYTNWYRAYEPYLFNIDFGHFGGVSKPIGKSIFFTSLQSNIILELDIDSMRIRIHTVGDKTNRYYCITYDGSDFWITKYMMPGTNQRQNAVVRWNKTTGQCKEFPLQPVTYDPLIELSDFASITIFDGRVLVLPYGVNEIYQIDPATEEITIFDAGLPYKVGDRKIPYYSYAYGVASSEYSFDDEGKPIAVSYYDYSLLYFEAGASDVKKQKIIVDGVDHLLRNADLISPYVHYESAFMTPSDFIDKVCAGTIASFNETQAQYHRSVNANSDGSCGDKVHEYVMRKIKKLQK